MYGAERVVATLARDASQAETPSYVGVFQNSHVPENQVPELLERTGLHVLRIPCEGRLDLKVPGKICEIAMAERIQILHTHGYKADIFGYLASKRLNIPILATCHLWTRQTLAIRVYEFLDRLILRKFDAVAAVSERIAEEAVRSGISRGKVSVIDNGIDMEPFAAAKPTLAGDLDANGQTVIGTVGRLVEQKGMRHFLAAAKLALSKNPKLKFVIVGDGPDRKALEQLACSMGVVGNVIFTGSRTDMPGVYASFDIFVLASLDEGLPMALLEAMASGRPCIATRVGAIPSVIPNGECGLLVEPADDEALYQALAKYIENAGWRRSLGEIGRNRVREKFSSLGMTRKYLRLYQQLCGETLPAETAPPVRDLEAETHHHA
jgi:glycosyltransferase involved in cell wall biosynthesis